MLTLSNDEISELDKMIQEMPFKHAFPLFNFLRTKIQQQAEQAQAAKIGEISASETAESKPKVKAK